MGNKELTALLRTLRRFGVTRYHDSYVDEDNQRHEMTLELGGVAELPAAPRKAHPGEDAYGGPAVGDAGFELPELGPEDDDPRTVLADLVAKNYPKVPTGKPPRTIGPEPVEQPAGD